jgi:hypothetical protein
MDVLRQGDRAAGAEHDRSRAARVFERGAEAARSRVGETRHLDDRTASAAGRRAAKAFGAGKGRTPWGMSGRQPADFRC